MRKIVVAFDHAGFDLHDIVVKTASECGFEVIDAGSDSNSMVDYPDYVYAAAQKILEKEAEKGIFVGGSGIGMCVAANKIKGIYAAVCHDYYSAHQAVDCHNINVLCLGSDVIGPETARVLISVFLSASFNYKTDTIRCFDKVKQIESGCFELKNNAVRLYENGQSIWLDNIQRGLIKNGKIAKDIENGIIRGITSNPTIFQKAISGFKDYENAITPMALFNIPAEDIFTQLTVEDIRNAADLFRDLYIRSGCDDGYVSLEVSPLLAHDSEKTAAQGKMLWKAVNRPNLMIKIPATREAIPAITELTAAGINLNLTLIFSPERYIEAANAYINGLRKRMENGESIEKIRSVSSVFISRIDAKVDALLAEKGILGRNLLGKTAVRNAQRIYNASVKLFESEYFSEIKNNGGSAQRVLWASTTPKNPLYKPTCYTESLVGKNTVCALTPETLGALLKSTQIKQSLPVSDEEIDKFFIELKSAGISIKDVYAQLEEEGINEFIKSFMATFDSIRSRSEMILDSLNNIRQNILENCENIDKDSIINRIFSKDPTVWTFDMKAFPEIRSRLGWLDTFKTTEANLSEYTSLRIELKKEGIKRILILGSYRDTLASETIAQIFSDDSDISLHVLNTVSPRQIIDAQQAHDPGTTLYIICGKSGTSPETQALMDLFYDYAQAVISGNAGNHFITITDPGTNLETISRERNFRKVFLSDPAADGNYSALSAVGILPAVLIGLEPQLISSKIFEMMKNCSPSLPSYRNEGTALGSFIGTAALNGMDKLTILADPEFQAFGTWIEQLINGSCSNSTHGVISVALEPNPGEKSYGKDRCFVYINLNNGRTEETEKLRMQGHPVFEISVDNNYDLFAEFYRWEVAAAVACSILNINPFDQSNAQDIRSRISSKISDYLENGKLKEKKLSWTDEQVDAYTSENQIIFSGCNGYNDVIANFLEKAEQGKNYISLNSYLPQNEIMTSWLQTMRSTILQYTGCATLCGFGSGCMYPDRQTQPGDQKPGFFILITASENHDIMIPNKDLSFGTLQHIRALCDYESLLDHGYHVLHIHFKQGLPRQD